MTLDHNGSVAINQLPPADQARIIAVRRDARGRADLLIHYREGSDAYIGWFKKDMHPDDIQWHNADPDPTIAAHDLRLAIFRTRVRDRRREEGWSQETLAKKVGISRNYLSMIERGVAGNPSWRIMRRITAVLGLSLSNIFDQRPEWRTPPPGVRVKWDTLSPGLREFASKTNLPTGDVEMLTRIRYRDKQPDTPEQWQLLYMAIQICCTSPCGPGLGGEGDIDYTLSM